MRIAVQGSKGKAEVEALVRICAIFDSALQKMHLPFDHKKGWYKIRVLSVSDFCNFVWCLKLEPGK